MSLAALLSFGLELSPSMLLFCIVTNVSAGISVPRRFNHQGPSSNVLCINNEGNKGCLLSHEDGAQLSRAASNELIQTLHLVVEPGFACPGVGAWLLTGPITLHTLAS